MRNSSLVYCLRTVQPRSSRPTWTGPIRVRPVRGGSTRYRSATATSWCCVTSFTLNRRGNANTHSKDLDLDSSDPFVFGPPGSGSGLVSQRCGSGSFYHQEKKVRKALISTVLWLLFDFLSSKNDVNLISKSNKQKNFFKLVFCWRLEGQWIAGSGSEIGSISRRHGSADLEPYQNDIDPLHCSKLKGNVTLIKKRQWDTTGGFQAVKIVRYFRRKTWNLVYCILPRSTAKWCQIFQAQWIINLVK